MKQAPWRSSFLYFPDDRVGELGGGRAPFQVSREPLAFEQHGFEGVEDSFGGAPFANVVEHRHRGENHRPRIGDFFALDVGRAAVDGFKQRVGIAEISAGHHAQTADQSRRQVGDLDGDWRRDRSPGAARR